MNIFEALANTEFGDKVHLYGIDYLIIKHLPDNLALAVPAGAGFPAPVSLVQLESAGGK